MKKAVFFSILFLTLSLWPASCAQNNLDDSTPQERIFLNREKIGVTIPAYKPVLKNIDTNHSGRITAVNKSFFSNFDRSTLEYVLTIAASIQMDFVNNNVRRDENGNFRQIVLQEYNFPGMYSLWNTSPPAFCVGNYVNFSSFFHELGHNFNLNTPAHFHYGKYLCGPALPFYTETLAQIFEYATSHEILSNSKYYAFEGELLEKIERDALENLRSLQKYHDDYIRNGKNFTSWNNPETKKDESLETFTTMSYLFYLNAERSKLEYRIIVKRLMTFFQQLNSQTAKQYAADKNEPKKSVFRSTFMITAMSYALEKDLRNQFKKYKFPVDDEVFGSLIKNM